MNDVARLDFEGHPVQFEKLDGEWWVNGDQAAAALGYKDRRQALRVYQRHADEFLPSETCVLNLRAETCGVNLTPNPGNLNAVRLFSPRGLEHLAILGRTPTCVRFRRWLLDVVEHLRARSLGATTGAPPSAEVAGLASQVASLASQVGKLTGIVERLLSERAGAAPATSTDPDEKREPRPPRTGGPHTRVGGILYELVLEHGSRHAVFEAAGINESYFAKLLNHRTPPGKRALRDLCRAFPARAKDLKNAWLKDRSDDDRREGTRIYRAAAIAGVRAKAARFEAEHGPTSLGGAALPSEPIV